MEKKDVKEILEKVSSGQYTAEEEQAAKLWLFQLHQNDEVKLSESQLSGSKQKVWDNLQIYNQPQIARVTRLWPRIAVAAVILMVAGAGLFFYLNSTKPDTNVGSVYANDIAPGKVGATLTLANGKKIKLSDAANGEIAQEASISVTKTADGQLVYEVKETTNDPNKINTLTTAKGETYALTLPDKSKVWLNAASSLTYSANLVQNGQRRLKLSGEAYLEVAKDKAHPFVVESKGQEVEVLGTHFNINAYEDDPVIKTTLAEGRVKVMASGKSIILRPNQQAITGNGAISMKEVDAELALAWKAGFFLFDRESLESIMLKIARWYDVEIVFNDASLKAKTFTGTVSRFEKISQVFNMMEQSQVAKFKIEGKKITIDKMK